MSWTDDRVELLRRLWGEGLSASQIAGELGMEITRNAVIGKVHRLGLSGRVKPAQAAVPRQRSKPEAADVLPTRPEVVVIGNTLMTAVAASEIQVAPAPRPTPVLVPSCERVTILDLRETMCRWPHGDPSMPEFRFCGARSTGGLPYCDTHRRIAYQPVHDRRRERERREMRS